MPSAPESAAVAKHGVRAAGDYAEADRVDTDGLPLVGAAVWPGQSYYTVINRTNGEHVSTLGIDGAWNPFPHMSYEDPQLPMVGDPADSFCSAVS